MKKKNPLICFFLVASVTATRAQEFKIYYQPDFSKASPTEKKPLLYWLQAGLQAGFQPGEIHYQVREDGAMPAHEYMKVGDGYFKRKQGTATPMYDTLKDKSLFRLLFKPVFHVNLSHHIFAFAAPEAGVFFNAKKHRDYGLVLDDVTVSVEKYDLDGGFGCQAILGADAGLGYVFTPRAILQLSAETASRYNQGALQAPRADLLLSFHFKIFS